MAQAVIEDDIQIKNVFKRFGDFEALKDVSLSVKPGERVVICGPSGSGKSTLIRCINGLERHEAGSIKVDGITLEDKGTELQQIRSKVGMVFQQFNLFPHLTVLDNITLGPIRAKNLTREQANKIAMTYLERVKIPEQANKYPRQLSGGQQQRVAIARSLCMEPKILLFDEPTSALDPELVGGVLNVMHKLRNDGMTMIVVSHEMRFAQEAADRVLFVDGGLIVEQNTPEEIFNNPQHQRTREFLSRVSDH